MHLLLNMAIFGIYVKFLGCNQQKGGGWLWVSFLQVPFISKEPLLATKGRSNLPIRLEKQDRSFKANFFLVIFGATKNEVDLGVS